MTRTEALRMGAAGQTNEELVAYCERELKKIGEKEEKRKEKVRESERGQSNEKLKEDIVEILLKAADWTDVNEIRRGLNDGYSRQKVTSMCTELVRAGQVEVTEINVPGVGKRKGYRLLWTK